MGTPLPQWKEPAAPARIVLSGRTCRVEPLDAAKHAESLWKANSLDTEGGMWTYLSYGPFATFSEYKAWLEKMTAGSDPCFYSIIDLSGHAVGVAAYLRIDAPNGVIEVGHLGFSPLLQKTIAATEAMHLMMRHAFEAGYRRYEWKCDSLNVPSRNAATRYGFQFEGIFRQAAVYKGRTRDTAWFSITDLEWPAIHAAFVGWLDPQNFDSSGRQKRKLESFRG